MKLLQELLKEQVITETLDKSLTNLAGQRLKQLPKGAPEEAMGNINISDNDLVSLKGSPRKVNGNFNCSKNKLMSFSGGPKKVHGHFVANNNKSLTSLKGMPDVDGNVDLSYCSKLSNFEGVRKVKIAGNLDISNCKSLKSLKGIEKAFEYIGGNTLSLYNIELSGGLLGVLKIDGNFRITTSQAYKPVASIINKHLGSDVPDLFDCQEEILELAKKEEKPEWEALAEM
jgi:hypothetical protein